MTSNKFLVVVKLYYFLWRDKTVELVLFSKKKIHKTICRSWSVVPLEVKKSRQWKHDLDTFLESKTLKKPQSFAMFR